MCKQHPESLVHLFLQCDFVRLIWFGSDLGICITSTPNHSISFWLGWLHHIGLIMSLVNRIFFSKILCILWCIWLARNKAVFESASPSPTQISIHANQLSQSITQARASLKPPSLSFPRAHSCENPSLSASHRSSNSFHLSHCSTDFTFHVNPCLCPSEEPVLDIFCAYAYNLQLKKSGVGVTFKVKLYFSKGLRSYYPFN